MSVLSLILPTIGQPDSTEDPKINTALTAIQTWANGNIDLTNMTSAANSAILQASTNVTTPTRVFGTPYQPNTTRPVMVLMTVQLPSTASATLYIAATSSFPSAYGALVSSPGSMYSAVTTLVPAGWWYQLTVVSGSASIQAVVEIRM